MKWTSLSAAALAAGVALATAPTARAIDPNRGHFNTSQGNGNPGSTIPNQNQTPVTPSAVPGQDFFNSFNHMGNSSDPFFLPEFYSPTSPVMPPAHGSPGTQFVPNPNPLPHGDLDRTRTQPASSPTQSQQRRWRLGVWSKDLDTGVEIHQIVAGAAADRAGLEVKDRIVAVSGYQVGFVNGQLFDCGGEFERHANREGWVTMLVQNHRNKQLVNVPVQLDSRLATLSGSLTIRNGQPLPPGSVINVELKEVVGSNAEPVTFAKTQIEKISGPPVPFEITYDPAHMTPSGQYIVHATVVQAGREVFRTAQNHPVVQQPGQTQPRPITVQLDRVQASYGSRPGQLDRTSQIAQIVKWFEAYLGRPPSDRELAVWLSAISNGYPLNQVQQELLGHNAFFNRCNQDKHVYVERVHELLIGRKPTQAEMNYWVGRYDAVGGIRRDLAREFQEALGIH